MHSVILEWIVAILFFGHGMAHLGGFLASWLESRAGFKDESWVFGPHITLSSLTGRISSPLWLVAMLGLIMTGYGILTARFWWPISALISCALSLCLMIVWWRVIPPGAKIGAVFNILVLAGLIFWDDRLITLF